MASDVRTEAELIATELHEFLQSADPSRARRELANRFRDNAEVLGARIEKLLAEMKEEPRVSRLGESLRTLAERLNEVRDRAPDTAERFQSECHQIRERIQPSYAALVAALHNQAIRAPNFRPTNLHRTLFHIASGVMALLTMEFLLVTETLYHWVPVIPPTIFWTLEIARRKDSRVNDALMKMLGKIAHPHEWERVNSGTWYGTAGAILVWTVDPYIACTAVMVLGMADPAASLIGRRYGKTKLWGGKSLEGLLAFWLVASFVGMGVLLQLGPVMPLSTIAIMAVASGLIAGIAETLSGWVDDNFTIPLISGWSLTALAALLGVGSVF